MKRVLIGLALVTLFAAVGCVAQLKNIQDAPITTASEKTPTLEGIGQAIISVGGTLGWKMERVKPGHLIGTLFLRSHMAKVDITFNMESYSITYNDSKNLNYDGTQIHKNYNGWVSRLDKAINREFSMM